MASTWQRGFFSNVWAEIVVASPYSYGSFVTTHSHAPSYCADDEDPCLIRYRASGVEGFEAESKLTYPTLATGVSLSFSLSLSLSGFEAESKLTYPTLATGVSLSLSLCLSLSLGSKLNLSSPTLL